MNKKYVIEEIDKIISIEKDDFESVNIIERNNVLGFITNIDELNKFVFDYVIKLMEDDGNVLEYEIENFIKTYKEKGLVCEYGYFLQKLKETDVLNKPIFMGTYCDEKRSFHVFKNVKGLEIKELNPITKNASDCIKIEEQEWETACTSESDDEHRLINFKYLK